MTTTEGDLFVDNLRGAVERALRMIEELPEPGRARIKASLQIIQDQIEDISDEIDSA